MDITYRAAWVQVPLVIVFDFLRLPFYFAIHERNNEYAVQILSTHFY